MATSIHIPQTLLEAVDRKARALKMSRNRLIVRALERELTAGSDWSPGFFEQLTAVDAETVSAIDELLASVLQARKSKPPRPEYRISDRRGLVSRVNRERPFSA